MIDSFEERYIDYLGKHPESTKQPEDSLEVPDCSVAAQDLLNAADQVIAEQQREIEELKSTIREFMGLYNPTHTAARIECFPGKIEAANNELSNKHDGEN